jgi:hypothetical protein
MYRDRNFAAKGERRNSVLESIISYPLYAIADSIGASAAENQYPDAREVPIYTADELRTLEANQGRRRAANAVQLATKAGACAGPMVDLLSRMRADGGGAASLEQQPAGFARMVLQDLGSTVYPPDRSCQ